MTIYIKKLKPQDFNRAMDFAKEGMNLSWYVKNKIALNLYSRYIFYEALLTSTTALGAYENDQLVGFILAEFYTEEYPFNYWHHRIYCQLFSKAMNLFGYKNTSGPYEKANQELFQTFKKNYPHPDGELAFFAVNPNSKGQGIGTLLLDEFASRYKNKRIFLYSDSGSTYPFYLKRGFEQVAKKKITIPVKENELLPLTCFIFSKQL